MKPLVVLVRVGIEISMILESILVSFCHRKLHSAGACIPICLAAITEDRQEHGFSDGV
eukprot:m.1157471 g.1157471  ORF g.1157471 m.1157471 type:complete len:58 (-) comp24495_c0_seq23:1392-1565(-)